jgi:hypothetical protein
MLFLKGPVAPPVPAQENLGWWSWAASRMAAMNQLGNNEVDSFSPSVISPVQKHMQLHIICDCLLLLAVAGADVLVGVALHLLLQM